MAEIERALLDEVMAELERATRKFPEWPTDPIHAMGVLNEEVGELNRAVLQEVYEPEKQGRHEVRTEAIQVAAMIFRFLASLDNYRFERSEQHRQWRAFTPQTERAPCERCGEPGQWLRQKTAYSDDNRNWACHCPTCQAEADDYWTEMWRDYESGRF